jgi:uncharacterized protein YbjT (DUF2867 family)
MRIVIFGANGQTGRLLTRRALDADYVVALATRPGTKDTVTISTTTDTPTVWQMIRREAFKSA